MQKSLSRIGKKLFQLANWLNEDHKPKRKISFSNLIKILALLIPLYGILYLPMFYKHFNVNYFLYFNPLDFLRIFYYNNVSVLLLILALSFFGLHLLAVYRNGNKKLPLRLIFLIISFFQISVGCIIIYNTHNHLRSDFILLFALMISINVHFVYFKYVDLLVSAYAFIYLLGALLFAKYQAIEIEIHKPSFDIVMKDGTYLLQKGGKDTCNYFVGNVTNYVFIFDGSLHKMRAVPIEDIKEIRFAKGNSFLSKK
ncbi:MAG: hypothetical protein AAFZ89_12960 [Bacteroidota bacterium]